MVPFTLDSYLILHFILKVVSDLLFVLIGVWRVEPDSCVLGETLMVGLTSG